jgi:hypothetical protein
MNQFSALMRKSFSHFPIFIFGASGRRGDHATGYGLSFGFTRWSIGPLIAIADRWFVKYLLLFFIPTFQDSFPRPLGRSSPGRRGRVLGASGALDSSRGGPA